MPSYLGAPEILIILVVALIVLGPKRLPEAGRQVGRALAEVKKWSQGLQSEIRDVMESEPAKPADPPSTSGPGPTVLTGGPGPPMASETPPAEPTSGEQGGAADPPAGGAGTGGAGIVSEHLPDVPGSTIPTNGSVTDDPSRN